MHSKLATSALFLASFGTLAAHADTFQFSFVGNNGGTSFTTTVDSTQVLDSAPGIYTVFNTPNVGTLYLFNPATTGFDFSVGSLVDSGKILYSGANANPTILPGTYSLTAARPSGVNGTLTVTDLTATPEPSSVALLATGLLGAAGTLRRRFLQR